VIALGVDLLRHGNHRKITGGYTDFATFASFHIDQDISLDFSHNSEIVADDLSAVKVFFFLLRPAKEGRDFRRKGPIYIGYKE
jgi:hypothetical protein